uniref:Uncharacterized protein n=1 Tax=Globisporangium ultimum (strain ATCC 200006 / CBS 805.95 / DAOM BR144) TaxID=431595 RepID=K3WDL8_GLOUD
MASYFITDFIDAALCRMNATLAAAQHAKAVVRKTPPSPSALKTAEATETVTIAAEEFQRMKEHVSALLNEAAHWRSEHSGLVWRFATATFACRAIEREAETAQHHFRRKLQDSRARCRHLQRRLDDSALERQELLQMIEKKRDLVNTAVDCAMTLEVRRIEVEEENERLAATIRRMRHEHAKALETKKREYRRVCTQLNDLCTSWAHYAEFLTHNAGDSAFLARTTPAKTTKKNSMKEATQKSASSRLRLSTPFNRRFRRKPPSTTESSSSNSDGHSTTATTAS